MGPVQKEWARPITRKLIPPPPLFRSSYASEITAGSSRLKGSLIITNAESIKYAMKPARSSRQARHCLAAKIEAAMIRMDHGRFAVHFPSSASYCVADFTVSPALKPEPETTVHTEEASSTSVALTMPIVLVSRRMTLPVAGSLISLVTRATRSWSPTFTPARAPTFKTIWPPSAAARQLTSRFKHRGTGIAEVMRGAGCKTPAPAGLGANLTPAAVSAFRLHSETTGVRGGASSWAWSAPCRAPSAPVAGPRRRGLGKPEIPRN